MIRMIKEYCSGILGNMVEKSFGKYAYWKGKSFSVKKSALGRNTPTFDSKRAV